MVNAGDKSCGFFMPTGILELVSSFSLGETNEHMALENPILVVEDDQDTRFLYAEVLQSEGYKVLEAGDGTTALEVLKANPSIGLILLDLTMPGMSASEFLIKQKEASLEHPIPVITISGRSDTQAQSSNMGANDYLLKPFDIDQLVDKVKNWTFVSGSHLTH